MTTESLTPPRRHARASARTGSGWLRRALWLSASALTLAAPQAMAQTAPAQTVPAQTAQKPAPVTILDAVTVYSDRGERRVDESTATISVIGEEEIERRGLHRLQDLPRYEPGVTVSNSPARAGAGGFAIRGITNNRILMQVDGTRLPESPASAGPSAGYNRDIVDFDALKQVEIVRGPSSALHGSDALGGVVSYVTKDPADYLRPGKDYFASLKGAYDSVDSSFSETGTAAMRSGDFSILGVFTRRDGKEYKSRDGGFRNPQDYEGNNALAKLVWDHGPDRITITGEYFQRDTDTTLRNDVGGAASYIFSMAPPRITRGTIAGSASDDEARRWRISLDHAHDAPVGFIDHIDWRAYATGFDRRENRTRNSAVATSTNTLFPARSTLREETRNESEQVILGAAVNFRSDATLFGLPNRISYGLSTDYIQTERLRDVTLTNGATGATAKSYNGDSYPSRTFPNTGTLMVGGYVQDEITIDRLRLVPALRLDYYRMNPEVDAAYLAANSSSAPAKLDKLALSPKFGVTYELTREYSVFGQYAHGFRAPPYDDANLGFSNPTYGYEVLPNPNLQPETSNGVEAGVRGKFGDRSSFQVSGYYNRYKNFIAQRSVGTSGGGLLRYQSQNVANVEIFGVEGKGEWRFRPGWALFGAAAFARGFDIDGGTAIDEVAPLTVNAGLSYSAPEDLWGARIVATHAMAKKDDDVSSPAYLKAPSATTVDLAAYVNPTEHLSLGASVNNLFDKEYYNYINVVGVSQTAADRRRYLEAGRSFLVHATVKW
ncbi:hemoglobin/transferrin/lactoferrin receptor protein [Azospirillum agricola]|uniref:TonB-dependent hemoglobin/transferrin/lactoferrin family receptor n=1 Tax=Azospirillum agricola TaxID=1720247 RepID=UPI001AE569E2|nr:TonB-dependent hemoglobin/transferrin/lactoferrin family receptor [Azospirillum agricola]MBP2228730.1 hemoglobin/transferrin/lactoferrin receptor protein [Azospirillum agricola]